MKEREIEQKKIWMQKPLVVWLGAFVSCLLWGSAYPCIKTGYQMMAIKSGDVTAQILYAGCRFALAGLIAIMIGSVGGRCFLHPNKKSIGKVCKLSCFQTIGQYVLFYIGLAHASGVKSSIIGGASAFVTILVASLLFRQERLTPRKLIGCGLGFAGVVLINLTGGGLGAGMSIAGEGFVFLSTVAYAFSSVLLKIYSRDANPVMLSGYQFLVGGLVMAAGGYLAGGRLGSFTITSMLLLFYMGCISAVAYSIWGLLLKYNPVSRIAVFSFMTPIFGVLLSAVILREGAVAAGARSIIALGLVCVGIIIVNQETGKA